MQPLETMQQLEAMQPLEDETMQPAPGCAVAVDDVAQVVQRADGADPGTGGHILDYLQVQPLEAMQQLEAKQP